MCLPTFIDIEASGLGRGTYPIEVGFITSKGEVGCTLIKPIEGWTHWSDEAESLHGISKTILAQHGKNISWVADWLNESLSGQIVYSDGWANDMSWLGKLFDEAEKPQQFKVESLLTLLTDAERECWSIVHDQVTQEACLTRHRASSDARIVQETFRRIKSLP